MGSTNSHELVYSADVPGQSQPTNCTKIRRNPLYLNYLWSSPMSEARNMRELYSQCFKFYAKNQCYGIIKDSKRGKIIEYVTYREVQTMVNSIGKAILYMDLPAEADDLLGHKLRLVGICSHSRLQWQIVAISCNMYNIVLVPIIEVLTLEDKLSIIRQTGMTTLFCSESIAKELSKASNLHKLNRMVFFDETSPETMESLKPHKIDCFKYSDLLEKGQLIPFCPYPVISPTTCATICFTSGTTGPPKGVIISHINITSALAVNKSAIEKGAIESDVHMSYVPLAHIFQRISILNFFLNGAKTVFSSGDINKFNDDLKLIRPCHLPGPSVLFHKLYDTIKPKFDQLEGCTKVIADTAINSKVKKLLETGDPESFFYDLLIFRKAREELGGNMKWMASGGSYLDPQARTFLQILFACPLIPVYGIIECTAVNFIVKYHDQTQGHVGGPTPNTEFKLVDVPELNLLHTNRDSQGQSRPRGELYLRGPGIFIGYFHDPEKTRAVKDKDGWLHTGDLAQILPNSGALRIVGRRRNAFKLQTGQVIIPQKIQQAIFRSGICEQICVYGDPSKKFLVAVIVPKKQVVEKIADEKCYVGSHEQLCQNMNTRREVASRLHSFCLDLGLQTFEIPKNIWLQPKSFNEKNILSQVLFVKRHVFSQVYSNQLTQMYSEGRIFEKQLLHISITSSNTSLIVSQ